VHAQEKKEEKKEEKEVKVVKKPDEVRRGPAFAVSKNMALAYAVAEPADAARAEQRRTQRARVPSTVPCRAGSPRHSQTRLLRACQNVMKEKISVEEEKMGKLQEKLTAIKEQLDKNDNNRPDANSELGIAKTKFNQAKSESRRLQQVARRRSNTERGP
jgi:hypothetical protein